MNKLHTFISVLLRALLLSMLLIALSDCTTGQGSKTGASQGPETLITAVSKSANEISIMSFNVENLFDTVHDEGTEDYTNLPLSEKSKPEVKKFCSEVKNSYYQTECFQKDWNPDVLKFKLSQVAKVLKSVDNGTGPDILTLAEVENLNVLNMLNDQELKSLGYQTIALVEGPDLRGIDPAIMSKFPLAQKPILHIIPYTDSDPEQLKYAKRSRGILEVVLKLPNKKELTVFAGHFPSQMGPTKWRKQATEFATKKMLEYAKLGRAVIMAGDLNITADEESDYGYFSKIFSSAGQVSHLVGCKQCEGSHFYKGHWSFLDAQIFGNKLDQAGLTLIPESITVLKSPAQTKRNGTPLRFNEEKKEGVSDHFPLYTRLKIK